MSQPVLEQSSTPIKHKSIQKLFEIEKKKSANRLKKLRAVRERKRRLEKKSARLENIIAALKCKMLASSEDIDLLSNIDTTNADFLKRYLDNENSPRKYSASLRKFAICLHFISPKAYMFIRKQFNTCLPHPKTLYKWYTCIDCDPGFTREAFDALKLLVEKSTNKILCCVSLDEMSIRQHLQWNGKQTVGYVNIGQHLDADNVPLAKDVLVFMVTSLNGSWKIPVGYFLTNGVNGEQRSTLLQNCVHLLKECGLHVVSITFDGCPSNLAMARNLGAKFDSADDIRPKINIEGVDIVICPDACHMLKLVRNTLADKKEMFNAENKLISWKFIENLHNLQENEGLRLANKITTAHINFKKQIMKVHLAAQTLSRSVAVALEYCKDELNIDDFSDSGATIEFIRYFNDIFDILNSRRLSAYGLKKPITKQFFLIINKKIIDFEMYVKNLKFSDGQSVVKSQRKTGFLGFLILASSIRVIYNELINVENAPLKYLSTYKMSQDHLEIFFSAIRSKGGFNNNPTALQFMSAYKRLLIHGELKNITTGNCIPLESINILTCSTTSLCKKINSRRSKLMQMTEDLDAKDKFIEIPDCHDYINAGLTEFSKDVTIYIAGYITTNLKKNIKCCECLAAIVSHEKYPGFIRKRDFGGLHYPSKDVIEICLYAEKVLRHILTVNGIAYFSNKNNLPKLIVEISKKFIFSNIFEELSEHILEQDPLENHLILLIRAITLRFLEVRIHFLLKKTSRRDERIRNFHTKLVLFKGQ